MSHLRPVLLAGLLGLALAVPTAASAAPCGWAGFKITNLQNTSCATAQKAVKYYYSMQGSSQGYTCKTTASSGYQAGVCRKSATRKFRFAPR